MDFGTAANILTPKRTLIAPKSVEMVHFLNRNRDLIDISQIDELNDVEALHEMPTRPEDVYEDVTEVIEPDSETIFNSSVLEMILSMN